MADTIPLDLDRFRANFTRISREVAEIAAASAGEQAGASAAGPRIVIVTKYLSVADSLRLQVAGYSPLGESRAAALYEKAPAAATTPAHASHWHFIGHLQRNKIDRVLPRIGMLHALDSRRLAAATHEWCATRSIRLRCLVQVNVSGEKAKGGISLAEAVAETVQWKRDFPALEILGLMTMAPAIDPERCRPFFQELRVLRDAIRVRLPAAEAALFRELSMGMSNDYPIAAAEGATLLRIGSALFR